MDSIRDDFSHLSFGDLHASTTTSALNQISLERDTFTDDDHKPLDAKIINGFSAFRKLNEEPDLSVLLSLITMDKRLTTLTTDEAEELLTREPSIAKILRRAWQAEAFKEVRQLEVLWPPQHRLSPKRRPRLSNEDIELTNKALKSAWRDNYHGENHKLLFANINRIPRTQKAYSNQIAIVQSSGTGKSRMVHEQANLVFTIPFNLRESGDSKDLAFPIPDDAVRDYFVTLAYSTDTHTLKTNYLKFLGGVFTQIRMELDFCRTELSKKRITSAGDLAKWWSSHLESVRPRLYGAAINAASKDIPIVPGIRKMHDELLANRRSKFEGSEDADQVDYDVHTVIEFAAAESAREALGRLINVLDHFHGLQTIKLVIYFDEAHPLTKVTPSKDDEKTLYDFLCSCLNRFLAYPVFTIFLSTNSSLVEFASPRALARSARIRGGLAVTHAPITETPFDCDDELVVRPGELKMKDISTISFMARFGRPLFWTLLRGAGMNAPEMHTEIMELARAKLVASRAIDSSYDTFPRIARMAVLDVQLSLDYEPRREKVQIEEAGLVESHMRIAYSIPNDREYLRSGYPSEPLLAEAAARQQWQWRTQDPFVVVNTLTSILDTGLLDRGELGELTGRHLLLDAYHRAVELEQRGRPEKTPPNFSAGCRLVTFIKSLYNDECAATVLNSTPDNLNGVPFREAFKDAIICFTHFGKMADDTGVTSVAAWVAFVRHMGIICRNGQRAVDCILPVLLWDTKICEHVITAVLIQFKRRKRSGTIAEYSIDEADIGFFPTTLEECTHGSVANNYRPYVGMIMELGVQTEPFDIAKTPTIFRPDGRSSVNKITNPRPRTRPATGEVLAQATPSKIYIPQYGTKHHPFVGHARYHIFAYGCSPTVYRGIDAAHKASYAFLLSSRDFLGEHPRSDAQSLAALRRMKPFWTGGDDCYHWVQHDDVLHGSLTSQRESIRVGQGQPDA